MTEGPDKDIYCKGTFFFINEQLFSQVFIFLLNGAFVLNLDTTWFAPFRHLDQKCGDELVNRRCKMSSVYKRVVISASSQTVSGFVFKTGHN